jgi:biotin synthase
MTTLQTGAERLVERSVKDAAEGRPVSDPQEIAALFEMPYRSRESALLRDAALALSQRICDGRAEVHAQTSMNVGPCPRRCMFCAFAEQNGVFSDQTEVPLEDLLGQCMQFETDGANAIFLMATGVYPVGRFLERAAEVRKALRPETRMVANVGDFDAETARRLKDAGFCGIYHAVRLGEGRDTSIPPEKRMETFRHARDAGLELGTCLEPVGPEHTTAELVEKLLITRDAEPVYSGSARRIPIPNTPMAKHGMVSEARMAHILAVARHVLPLSVKGNCTHEPNALGAAAGANLFWAETGANPRDTHEHTEEARGLTVPQCRAIFGEADWGWLDGPSVFYG